MPRPTSKSEETRRRILAAALRTFREKGFDQATMRQVAAEAKVALGAAYYYFDSKDAIVMAFYEQAQQELTPALDELSTLSSAASAPASRCDSSSNRKPSISRPCVLSLVVSRSVLPSKFSSKLPPVQRSTLKTASSPTSDP